MEYIVTGHRGYLGRKFVRLLEETGIKSYTFDDDITNEVVVTDMPNDFVVVHFAGNKNNDKDKSLRNNIIATSQIVRLAQQEHCKGLLYVSTIAVYGATKGKVTEETEKKPASNYAKSKFLCEEIIKNFLNEKSYFILRPTNIYEGTKVGILAELYRKSIQKEVYEIWEESFHTLRDYISVDDVIRGIYDAATLLKGEEQIQEEINIASGYSYSLESMMEFVEKKYGVKILTNVTSNPNFLKYDLIVDNKKCRRLLNLVPKKVERALNI